MEFDYINEVVREKGVEVGYLVRTESGMNWRVFLYNDDGPPIQWGVV